MIELPFLPVQFALALLWLLQLWRRRAGLPWPQTRAALLLLMHLELVLQLTFVPLRINLGGLPRIVNLVPLVESLLMLRQAPLPLSLYNLMGNFILLLPLGILLPQLDRRWRSGVAVFASGVLLSLGIETLQWLTGCRIFDIDDILLNSLGALAGWALWRALRWRTRRRRRAASERAQLAGDGLHAPERVGKEALIGGAEAVR
ncbi:MAG: VanZ family protein [Bacillota bacterium]|nr:VanZ family protein [Bacillota bacterium]